jgi:hypothetical protein
MFEYAKEDELKVFKAAEAADAVEVALRTLNFNSKGNRERFTYAFMNLYNLSKHLLEDDTLEFQLRKENNYRRRAVTAQPVSWSKT